MRRILQCRFILQGCRDEPDSVGFGAWAVDSQAVEVTAVYTDREDRNFLIARVWRKHDSHALGSLGYVRERAVDPAM